MALTASQLVNGSRCGPTMSHLTLLRTANCSIQLAVAPTMELSATYLLAGDGCEPHKVHLIHAVLKGGAGVVGRLHKPVADHVECELPAGSRLYEPKEVLPLHL